MAKLAPEGRKFVCIAKEAWSWGASNALGGAVRAARSAVPTFLGPRAKDRMSYVLYETGAEAYVTEHGQLISVEPVKLLKEVTWVGDQRQVKAP